MKQNQRPEVKPHTYDRLAFDKGSKATQGGKDGVFRKQCWESWIAACKSMKSEQILSPYTKINSKRFTDLNIRHGTIKLLEQITGKTFLALKCTNAFLDLPRQKKDKPHGKTKDLKHDLMKLTWFYTAKGTIDKMKRQTAEWEKIFANDATLKDLISKIDKQLIQLNNKKPEIAQSKNGQTYKCFSRADLQMANRHMKRCSTWLIIREMQSKLQ